MVNKIDNQILIDIKWHIITPNKYNHTKYMITNINGKTVYLHRFIMEKIIGRKLKKGEIIDHINGNGLDNRRENLRICTQKQNTYNQVSIKNMSSKYKGVYYRKDAKKYQSKIIPNRKTIHLGYFKTEEEAALAYNLAAIKYFGIFARLNQL